MGFYFVYILLSQKDNKFYIGFSSDVFRRLKEHNSGENKSTKKRRPFILIYFEAHTNKKDALRREKYFKTSSGKKSIRLILRESLEEKLFRTQI